MKSYSCFCGIGAALHILRLEIPSIVDPRWERVPLKCEYDLENKDLYSVKWYKDGIEFFRFMPGAKPTGRDYLIDGVRVDLNRSDSKQVTLRGQANNKGMTPIYKHEPQDITHIASITRTYRIKNEYLVQPCLRNPVCNN